MTDFQPSTEQELRDVQQAVVDGSLALSRGGVVQIIQTALHYAALVSIAAKAEQRRTLANAAMARHRDKQREEAALLGITWRELKRRRSAEAKARKGEEGQL